MLALALASVAGCFAPQAAQKETPFKGEPLQIRYILGAHPNKEACVAYKAADNSCTSIITSEVTGDTMISRERTLAQVKGFQAAQEVEILTRSTLVGMKACRGAADIQIKGRDVAAAAALLAATRVQIMKFGGSVCNTYFRSGHGYVLSSTGANGNPFPPGDISYHYIYQGDLKLRLD